MNKEDDIIWLDGKGGKTIKSDEKSILLLYRLSKKYWQFIIGFIVGIILMILIK